jgi:succinyl-CoA synthetase beta subunit
MASHERLLPYRSAAALLESFGIPLAPAELVDTPQQAASAARSLGFPVALKALSPQLTHKSDTGLVRLGLTTAGEIQTAAEDLLAATAHVRREGLLVQRMIPGGLEMIAGVDRDSQFGPMVALGPGGVLVELLDDMVLRLPPLTRQQALAMVQETRSWPLLQGYRGQPAADVDALVQLLVNLSHLAIREASGLVSLDLNPVIVLPQGEGIQVVDLRVVFQSSAID